VASLGLVSPGAAIAAPKNFSANDLFLSFSFIPGKFLLNFLAFHMEKYIYSPKKFFGVTMKPMSVGESQILSSRRQLPILKYYQADDVTSYKRSSYYFRNNMFRNILLSYSARWRHY